MLKRKYARRVIVTASRTWDWPDIIEMALQNITGYAFQETAGVTVVHGGAKGGDLMAAKIAKAHGFKTEVVKADWYKYGDPAGHIRNAEMINKGGDILLAFIHNSSPGASGCLALAISKGLPNKVYRVEDEESNPYTIQQNGRTSS